jgi:Tfp pilus assembly pilus retraction ATPase PilT
MRRIVTKIPNFEDLNLPPQVEQFADVHRGIVIVSGTTGSGKSTTLAAIIGKINRTRAERIITVEDPIEFQHENAKSPGQPGRGRHRQRELRICPAGDDAPGPGRDPDRRNPRQRSR